MEVDVSLIIGYVMKFNYVLPYNASYLTDSYVRYDRSIDRDGGADGDDDFSPGDEGTPLFFPRASGVFFQGCHLSLTPCNHLPLNHALLLSVHEFQ